MGLCVCVCTGGACVECSCKCMTRFPESCQDETSCKALYRTWTTVYVCFCSSTSIINFNALPLFSICARGYFCSLVLSTVISHPHPPHSLPYQTPVYHVIRYYLLCRSSLIFHSVELEPTELVWFVYLVFLFLFLLLWELRVLVNIKDYLAAVQSVCAPVASPSSVSSHFSAIKWNPILHFPQWWQKC